MVYSSSVSQFLPSHIKLHTVVKYAGRDQCTRKDYCWSEWPLLNVLVSFTVISFHLGMDAEKIILFQTLICPWICMLLSIYVVKPPENSC